ncbi:MAG: molybdate ABC transporter substrate-binding protein, partial [Clostridiales bacterium]
SLRQPMEKMAEDYKVINPNLTVNFNFGASGALLQQLENGAPGDVFISAATKQMDKAVEKGLVDEASRFDWLNNKLVVAVPIKSDLAIASIDDVEKADTIAIGAPDSVPVGSYAKEALTKAGKWEKVEPKAVMGKDVSQVLSFVESGSAQLGFVYSSDLIKREDKAKIAFEVPADLYSPIVYPAAILKSSQLPEGAAEFVEFMKSEQAQTILKDAGFTVIK